MLLAYMICREMFGNGVLTGIMAILHQTIPLISKVGLLSTLKVPHRVLTAAYVAAVGTTTCTSALWAIGTTAALTTGTSILASAWLGGLELMGNYTFQIA